MQVTLIANAEAGAGGRDADDIAHAIRAAGHGVRSVTYGAPQWQRTLAGPADVVAVWGGDGTVGRVAKRMIGRAVPLAVLAAGTANNIALTLGVESLSLEDAIASWPGARRYAVDVAVATGPWGRETLVEGFGCGLLASAIRRHGAGDEDNMRKLAPPERLAQSLQVLKERVGAFDTTHVQASIDGRDISGDYVLFEAMNTPFVGPNLFLAPDGRPDDGLLDIVRVGDAHRARLRDELASWQRGAMRATPDLDRVRGRVLTLESSGYALHLDDRPWPENAKLQRTSGAIEVRVEPKAVEFLVPTAR